MDKVIAHQIAKKMLLSSKEKGLNPQIIFALTQGLGIPANDICEWTQNRKISAKELKQRADFSEFFKDIGFPTENPLKESYFNAQGIQEFKNPCVIQRESFPLIVELVLRTQRYEDPVLKNLPSTQKFPAFKLTYLSTGGEKKVFLSDHKKV